MANVFKGQEVGGTDFNRRRLCITKELEGPRREAMERGTIDRLSEPFSVRAKDFWSVVNARTVIYDVLFSLSMSYP